MTTETREFTTAELLTVIDGKMMCPIGRIYEILNWVTRDNLMTHQLPRASREAEPFLRETFPSLAAITVPAGLNSQEKVETYVASLNLPESWPVPRMPSSDHARIDPILELQHMVGADKVITISA